MPYIPVWKKQFREKRAFQRRRAQAIASCDHRNRTETKRIPTMRAFVCPDCGHIWWEKFEHEPC